MSYFTDVTITAQDSPSIDAFGRWRVSEPETLFDSKLLFDAAPLRWDDQETSGSGTSSSFTANNSLVTMAVSNTTAGTRVRQTFQRFNYQPGKSQLILLTGVLGAGASGITRRVGLFDTNNGLFFELAGTTLKVVVRSYTSGSPVDTAVAQASWNLDKLNGSGPSGVTLDTSKAHIFLIDYEWLGVGRVRFGVVIDGLTIYCHEVLHANSVTTAYMQYPNLPLRYELSNDGTGGVANLLHICSTVMSEGGQQDIGVILSESTAGTHVDANLADTVYACVGLKLQTAKFASSVKLVAMSMIAETNDDFEWLLYLNPTLASGLSYSNKTNSVLQTATGATANTVSGGTILDRGFAKASASIRTVLDNALALGATIAGTPDEIVLACRPLSANADIQASLTWRELT